MPRPSPIRSLHKHCSYLSYFFNRIYNKNKHLKCSHWCALFLHFAYKNNYDNPNWPKKEKSWVLNNVRQRGKNSYVCLYSICGHLASTLCTSLIMGKKDARWLSKTSKQNHRNNLSDWLMKRKLNSNTKLHGERDLSPRTLWPKLTIFGYFSSKFRSMTDS